MSKETKTIVCETPNKKSLAKDSQALAAITSMTSEQTGLIYTLSNKENNLLGSSKDSLLYVPYPGVSRQHSCISYMRGGYFIEDLKSTNGTYINGQLLSGKRKLINGDLISIGSSTVLRFNLYSNLEVDYHNKISQKLMFDELTRTLNKSTYEQIIASELDDAKEKHLPISLLMLDIDNFNALVDKYGNLAGNSILKKLQRK